MVLKIRGPYKSDFRYPTIWLVCVLDNLIWSNSEPLFELIVLSVQ